MNFWLIIFNYDQWKELIVKNCSKRTLKEWYIDENQNIPIGVLYASLGSFFVLMYIPFLIVMMRPEFIKYSCYKLMALIGIIDVFSTFVDGVVAGVQSDTPLVYLCLNESLRRAVFDHATSFAKKSKGIIQRHTGRVSHGNT
uniref:Uncharacterized protein n=1 Tax=Acrobeloides nanus TaxID=290746 RepID=A0A914EJH9_9BILA